MSTLIVLLPVQPRLSARPAEAAPPAPTAELDFVFSSDGRQVSQQGRGAPAAWPAAQTLVAVVAPADIAWHRITAPKAPAARLRLALAGMLEEVLLDDESLLHLAVAPGMKAGEPVWVACVAKGRLAAQIEAIEVAGRTVDRVVPAWAPDDAPAGHVFRPARDDGADDPGPWLAWRDAEGPVCLPASNDACRVLLSKVPPDMPVRWTATPDSADDAARLAGTTVAAVSPADFAWSALRGDWNLRQFDLAPRRRGSRAAAEVWRHFLHDTAWRPVRLGLLLLVGANLVGANVWAWQQRQALTRQKQTSVQLLQATFPNVRAVRDAPVQMQKEVDLLRVAAGRPGETDLEPMLQAADTAWPPSRAPADSLKFEPGRLTIGSAGWSPPEVDGFRARLRPLGFDVEAVPGRLTLSPYVPKPGETTLPAPTGQVPVQPVTGAPPGPGTGAPPVLPAGALASPAPLAGQNGVPPVRPPPPMAMPQPRPQESGALVRSDSVIASTTGPIRFRSVYIQVLGRLLIATPDAIDGEATTVPGT